MVPLFSRSICQLVCLTHTLDAGAALLQSRPPIDALNAYLNGFHFYNGHPEVQMEAHHCCSILNEEVIQCVIYDGNRKDVKLMGVNNSCLPNCPMLKKRCSTAMFMR